MLAKSYSRRYIYTLLNNKGLNKILILKLISTINWLRNRSFIIIINITPYKDSTRIRPNLLYLYNIN